MLTVEAAAEEGVAVRGVGGEVSVKAETGVEWREVERRSTLLEPALDCVPFLDAVGAMLECAAEDPAGRALFQEDDSGVRIAMRS
jgi:hypothetical protein